MMLTNQAANVGRMLGENLYYKPARMSPIASRWGYIGPRAIQSCEKKERSTVESFQAYGVATAGEVTEMLREHVEQPISVLARWIVARQVIAIPSPSDLLLPLFQFDLAHMTLRLGMASVMTELTGVMDDTECAEWFALPNGWLYEKTPAEVISTDPSGVVDSARAYRFVING